MEVMKQLRQRAIRDLVEQRPIRTQQELAAALRERGFRATQATISRDVAELGLVKGSREGRPGLRAAAAPASRPRRPARTASGALLADLPVEIREAGLLLVIRTLPGLGPRDRGRARPRPAGRRSPARSPATTPSSSRTADRTLARAACATALHRRSPAGRLTADGTPRFDTPPGPR